MERSTNEVRLCFWLYFQELITELGCHHFVLSTGAMESDKYQQWLPKPLGAKEVDIFIVKDPI